MWVITKNFINGDTYSVQVASSDYKEGKHLPYKFRIYDDDGELYFAGRSDDNSSEDAFLPLDDYAMPAYGATEIHYKDEIGHGFSLL